VLPRIVDELKEVRCLEEVTRQISDMLLKSLPVTYLRVAREIMAPLREQRSHQQPGLRRARGRPGGEGLCPRGAARLRRLPRRPVGGPVILSWNRVLAAMSDAFDRLVIAVEKDSG
jgi:hypothetical protein